MYPLSQKNPPFFFWLFHTYNLRHNRRRFSRIQISNFYNTIMLSLPLVQLFSPYCHLVASEGKVHKSRFFVKHGVYLKFILKLLGTFQDFKNRFNLLHVAPFPFHTFWSWLYYRPPVEMQASNHKDKGISCQAHI